MSPDSKDGEAGEVQPTLNDLRIYAGRLLARREFAVGELRGRLERKWPAEALAGQVIEELLEVLQLEGALSDQRFADSFIRSRVNRFQGPLLIRAQLRERQVPENIVESSLVAMEEQWAPLAAAWVSRHSPGALDFAGRAKLYRRLMNRGFSHQQAREALPEH